MKIKYEYKEEGNEFLTPCPFGKDCTVGSWVCNECKHHLDEDQAKRIVKCSHPPLMSKTDQVKRTRRKWRQRYLEDLRAAIRKAMKASGASEAEIKSALHNAHKHAKKAFNEGMRCADINPIEPSISDVMEDYTKGWLFRRVLLRPNIKLDEAKLRELLASPEMHSHFDIQEFLNQKAIDACFVQGSNGDMMRKGPEQLAP